MERAKPVFQDDGLVSGVEKFAVPRMKHHPDFDMDIDHPDAQAIAHAPADVAALVQCVRQQQTEIARLRCCGNCELFMVQLGEGCCLINCELPLENRFDKRIKYTEGDSVCDKWQEVRHE